MIDPSAPPPVLGPTRISGGPRSGKTEVLARLVAHWLAEGGDPSRLVVVTRSHQALFALETRIASLLPPCHLAPRLVTQEGLARCVLRELGEPATALVALGRLGEWMAMREALQEVRPLLRWLDPLADDPGCVDDLLEFVSLVKQSLVGPGVLASRLRDDRGLLVELALLAGRYQDILARMGARDTRDLTSQAVTLLEQDPSRLANWADLLLVDDAEELSFAQWRLTSLLGQRLSEPRRLVMAGDRRVSIPSFRGPSPRFLDEAYPLEFHPTEWELGDRGAAWACAAVAWLGASGMGWSADAAERELAALRADPPKGVEIWTASDELHEALSIAREIRRAHLSGELRYEEVAVLLWDPARQMAAVRAAMSEVEVPVAVDQHRWSESVVGRVVLAWLVALTKPEDDAAVAECLGLGPHGLAPARIWELRQEAARAQEPLGRALVRHALRVPGAADPARAPALLWQRLGGGGPGRTTQVMAHADFTQLVLELERSLGLVELALHEPASASAISQLAGILEEARVAVSVGRTSATNLSQWVDLLQTAVRRAGPEQTPTHLRMESAVTVTSVQRAKGLSWRWVFVPGMTADADPGRPGEGGILGTSEAQQLMELVPELDEVIGSPQSTSELELRLLLVALSRARERTVLSWSHREARQGAGRSAYLTGLELEGIAEGPAPRQFPLTRSELCALAAAGPGPGDAELGERGGPEVAADAAQIMGWIVPWDPTSGAPVSASRDLSATSLAAWLGCPRLYHYATLRLRRRDTYPAVLGTMAHRLLDRFHREQVAGGQPAADFAASANRFVRDELMPEVRARLVDPLQALYVELWLQRLVRRWEESVITGATMGHSLASEIPFQLDQPSHSLRGKVDALWRGADGALEVVDYKTTEAELPSVPEMRREVFGDPAQDAGPSNWQLPIYVLAARAGVLAEGLDGELPTRARNWYLSAEDPRRPGFPTRGFRLGEGGERVGRSETLLTWTEIDRIEVEIARQATIISEGRRPAAPRHDKYTCRGYQGCALGFCCDGEGSVGRAHRLPVPQP